MENKQYIEHPCTTLKLIRWNYYSFDTNLLVSKNDKLIYDIIDLYLDQILITNQNVTNVLTDILIQKYGSKQFYIEYPFGIFPYFIRKNNNKLLLKFGDEIIKEYNDYILNNDITFIKNINMNQFHNNIFLNNDIFNIGNSYIKIQLLQKYINKKIFSPDELETGFIIGSLIYKQIEEYKKEGFVFKEPEKNILLKRFKDFKLQTKNIPEERILEFKKIRENINSKEASVELLTNL